LLVAALARAFLAGEPTDAQIVVRSDEMFGRHWRWVGSLAHRYLEAYGNRTRPRHREVTQFLLKDRGFQRAWSKYANELSISQWLTETQQMQPVATARSWSLPTIDSALALAVWLGLSPGELEWFADLKGLGRGRKIHQQLRHYHYRLFVKRSGNVRLIESPKPRLKELQRIILALLLDKIPLHPAVHGFCKGRSITTFTAPHVGQRVVLRMDLQDFFPSISRARVQALLRTAGYPEPVADLLGAICTNAAPRDVWTNFTFHVDAVQLTPGRANFACPRKSVLLPDGLPPGWFSEIRRRRVHPVCRRSRIFRRRGVCAAC
jgi:RNA-directed DNA polymerase